jgi:16S rRNA processing protein RimM
LTAEDLILVGTIERPHGLHGEVAVHPFTDFPAERFVPGARFVTGRGAAAPPEETTATLVVDTVRWHKDRPLVLFEGVETVEAAEELRGRSLWIPAASRPALEPGLFYETDLVGCRVETADGPIGTVTRVEGAPGASVLVVETERGDVLVPVADAICRVIDPAAKRIVIEAPEGLLDLNAAPAVPRQERRAGRRHRRPGKRERGTPR